MQTGPEDLACQHPTRTSISCCELPSNRPGCFDSVTATKIESSNRAIYGERNGVIKLLTYQVGGSSSGPLPNWRWMETGLISDAELLDQTFPGGRPTVSGKHHKWDKLFLRVKPVDKK